MPPMMEIITAEQLMEYLGECLQLLNLLRKSKLPTNAMSHCLSKGKKLVIMTRLRVVLYYCSGTLLHDLFNLVTIMTVF